MNTIIELLNYPFMQRAIICGMAISFCAALIGVILVLKNYSMIGHGLGEVGFAALSLALVFNLPEMSVAIPIVIIASFIILLISQKKRSIRRCNNSSSINRSISIWSNNNLNIKRL